MAFIYSRRLLSVSTINRTLKNLYSQDTTNVNYDIIIAGGGMVGTSLACALGKKTQLQDKQILLLEGSNELHWKLTDKYSNRVVALTPHTKEFFESLGVWDDIVRTRFGSVKKMQVWDACSDAMITFNNEEMIDPIAYIVENDLLMSAINKVVKTIPNITVVYKSKIKDYILPQRDQTTVEVLMEDDQTYTCSLLLGADGAKSKVREAMGCQYLSWDYKQMGVVATLKLSEVVNNIVAWQRFLPTGPIALLPLNDCKSSLVWSTSTEHAKHLLQMPEDQFIDEINQSLWKTFERESLIDTFTKGINTFVENLNLPSNAVRQLPPNVAAVEPGSRAAFPLGFGHSTNYVTKGVALVGDAAHRVHPLAGQGVNLGFGDASCLADLVAEAVYTGRSLGSLIHLKQYETLRQRYNVPTMLAIDGLQKLYCTQLTPIVLLRSLGLQLTHALNPVKKLIIDRAAS